MSDNTKAATIFPGVGVVVGRFQTPELHAGHQALIRRALQHQKSIFFIGVHPTPVTKEHPLDFMTRKLMIEDEIAEQCGRVPANAFVVPILDQADDEAWSVDLDKMIRLVHPFGPVRLYYGRDSFFDNYTGIFRADGELLPSVTDTAATSIRAWAGGQPVASEAFRAGAIYASQNMYPRVQPTVDIAVLRRNGTETMLLLGRKASERKYRFVGGFVDGRDATGEEAAARECAEETGINVSAPDLTYVGSMYVNDWRNTQSTTIFTTLYYTFLSTGPYSPKAADDLAEASWFVIKPNGWLFQPGDDEQSPDETFVPQHLPLYLALLKKLKPSPA